MLSRGLTETRRAEAWRREIESLLNQTPEMERENSRDAAAGFVACYRAGTAEAVRWRVVGY